MRKAKSLILLASEKKSESLLLRHPIKKARDSRAFVLCAFRAFSNTGAPSDDFSICFVVCHRVGICQDTSKKLVRSLFTPEEPQQGLCPYASLPQDIF